MRVLLFHPVELPARDYGGTERVVIWLARALRELGHTVSVVCRAGSRLPDGIEAVPVDGELRGADAFFKSIGNFRKRWDVVHFMAPPGAEYSRNFAYPSITTVHGNGKVGEVFPANTIFVSADHARRHGRTAFVHNGIDPAEYRFSERKRERYLFLSKTSWPVKNLAGALDLADAAKFRLAIAGGNRPYGLRVRAYFRGHAWEGPVGGERKAALLADARGLVFPVRWDEPFGLVVTEALVSGTPVFAPARGSLTELIPETVGVLYPPKATVREQAELFRELAAKRPRDCEEWVRSRFTHLHMGRNYVKYYEKVLRGEML